MALAQCARFLQLGSDLVDSISNDIGVSFEEQILLQTALIDFSDTLINIAERYSSNCRCGPSNSTKLQNRLSLQLLMDSRRKLRMDRESARSVIRERCSPDASLRIDNIVEEHMSDVKRLTAMGLSWSPLYQYAKQVGCDISSHAATAFLALVRLCIVPQQKSMVLHVVGAEMIEGATAEHTARQWELLVRLLALGGATKLVLIFVGPQVPIELDSQILKATHEADNDCQLDLEVRWSKDFYHDWWKKRGLHLDAVSFPMPDLVLLPNAGIWVFEEWEETLRLVYSRIRRPLVVTAKSLYEAIKDEVAMRAMDINSWLWRPEVSPYPADPWTFQPDIRLVRTSPDDRAKLRKANVNAAWQCIFAQARESCSLEGAPCEHLQKFGLLRQSQEAPGNHNEQETRPTE